MMTSSNSSTIQFARNTNQVRAIAQFAIDALNGVTEFDPAPAVLARTELFYRDATWCGLSALALLGHEGLGAMYRFALTEAALAPSSAALRFGKLRHFGAHLYGNSQLVHPATAAFVKGFAVRCWDSNGTNFACYPELGHLAGEFGHNDFYEAVIDAVRQTGGDGDLALRAMILHDEIRNRLGSVFALKNYRIDHVVHGAVATAFVVGAVLGATAEQIDQAVGITVAHYVPTRAIRAGDEDLSDSKGASAALSTEVAVRAVLRVMQGFRGPTDIFRNPEAIFRLFAGPGEPAKVFARGDGKLKPAMSDRPAKESPFDIVLTVRGDQFAIMQMHVKLALYEHQSAGAVAGLLKVLRENPALLQNSAEISAIEVGIYEPAYGIICLPKRWEPESREAADHSAPYILSRLLRKAIDLKSADWRQVMLQPMDFAPSAIQDTATRSLMKLVSVQHRADFDARYPEGIPTEITVRTKSGAAHSSGLVMFPPGHAKYSGKEFGTFEQLFEEKMRILQGLAFPADVSSVSAEQVDERYRKLSGLSADTLASLHTGYSIPDRSKEWA